MSAKRCKDEDASRRLRGLAILKGTPKLAGRGRRRLGAEAADDWQNCDYTYGSPMSVDSSVRRRYTCLISLHLRSGRNLAFGTPKSAAAFSTSPMHGLALSRHVYARFRFGLLEPRDEHRCKDAEIPSRPVTVSWRQHLKPAGLRFGHQICRRVCIGQVRAPAPSRQGTVIREPRGSAESGTWSWWIPRLEYRRVSFPANKNLDPPIFAVEASQ